MEREICSPYFNKEVLIVIKDNTYSYTVFGRSCYGTLIGYIEDTNPYYKLIDGSYSRIIALTLQRDEETMNIPCSDILFILDPF